MLGCRKSEGRNVQEVVCLSWSFHCISLSAETASKSDTTWKMFYFLCHAYRMGTVRRKVVVGQAEMGCSHK